VIQWSIRDGSFHLTKRPAQGLVLLQCGLHFAVTSKVKSLYLHRDPHLAGVAEEKAAEL
jgi:hypothetical protein